VEKIKMEKSEKEKGSEKIEIIIKKKDKRSESKERIKK
jgi:hypothetical protein